MNYDDWELLVVSFEEDTPENRAAGEKALREKGVNGDIRMMTHFDIINDLHTLRMDGYRLVRMA